MKVVSLNQAKPFENGANCTAWEYSHANKDIDIAVINLSGPYPETGYAVNTQVTELVYIIEGRITLETEHDTTQLTTGDSVMLEANEKFRWSGNGKMTVSCHPTWNPQQYKYVN